MIRKGPVYDHAWDATCRQYLQWLRTGNRKIAALMCGQCGKDYPVSCSTHYTLAGSVWALAAVEAPVRSRKRGKA